MKKIMLRWLGIVVGVFFLSIGLISQLPALSLEMDKWQVFVNVFLGVAFIFYGVTGKSSLRK
jgi:uncharacterized membrane protein